MDQDRMTYDFLDVPEGTQRQSIDLRIRLEAYFSGLRVMEKGWPTWVTFISMSFPSELKT